MVTTGATELNFHTEYDYIASLILNQYGGKELIIPDNVNLFFDTRLPHTPNLERLRLPTTLTEINYSMFYNCDSLVAVEIPSSVTKIGSNAFSDSDALSNIVIPDSVTEIAPYAFSGCTSLTSATIPTSVTSIGENAFNRCPNLTIYGQAGSYAQQYALDNQIPFVAGGQPVPAPDTPSAWAVEQVNAAITTGLVPDALQSKYTTATTRAEFCALAVALYETVTGEEITERSTFTDTTDINVEKMAALGVVSGVGDNRFSPDTELTREQAATMLSRLASALGKTMPEQASDFADNADISSWAADGVGQVQAAGIMSGVGDNTFAPTGVYTREQSIVTMLRLHELLSNSL